MGAGTGIVLAVMMLLLPTAFAEEVRVDIPPGWGKWQEVLRQRIDLGEVVARIPAKQDMRTWTEGMEVTTLNLPSKKRETIVVSAIQESYKQAYAACEKLNVVTPKIQTAGDFAVAYGHAYCQGNRQHRMQGRIEVYKVTASATHVYVVKMIKVVPSLRITDPSDTVTYKDEKEAKEAAAWLDRTGKFLLSSALVCPDKATAKDKCAK